MATRLGSLEQLSVGKGIRTWFERFEVYCDCNELFEAIPDLANDGGNQAEITAANTKNSKLFLAYCSAEMYSTVKSLVNPNNPTTKSYDQLKQILCNHFEPAPAKTLQRYLFSKCDQKNLSIQDYVSELRTIANTCEFTANEFESRICDQFVAGVVNQTLKKKLLSETNLTLALAVEKAVNEEKSAREANLMGGSDAFRTNKVSSSKPSTPSTSKQRGNSANKPVVCKKCLLRGHDTAKCKTKCFYCKKNGHSIKNCRSKMRSTNHVENDDDDSNFLSMGYVNLVQDDNSKHSRHMVSVKLNGEFNVSAEFDSGSTVSVMSIQTLRKCCDESRVSLTPTPNSLRVANGQETKILGKWTVDVEFNGVTKKNMELFIVKEKFPTLFGRAWIHAFMGKDWLSRALQSESSVVSIKPGKMGSDGEQEMCPDDEHTYQIQDEESKISVEDVNDEIEKLKENTVFKPGLGLVKDYEAKLTLKDDAKPVFLKARSLPYALRDKVGKQLKTMEEQGILSKVETSQWATPIVAVQRNDKIRICGDYKSTLNKSLETHIYPLPSVDECFHAMKDGQRFTVLDIKSAYNNLLIRESDRKLTVINTTQGLYQWNRLPYGISSSAAIFQENMDKTLEGLKRVVCRIDDILISGKDNEEHLMNLRTVVTRLEERGFKCKLEKSQFFLPEVQYLGHVISAEGIRPSKSKVEDLKQAPTPQNVDQLISFLGAVNYYRRYLPNLSTVIEPLENLRTKTWKWGKREKDAYQKLKDMLCSDRVLMLYDPGKPLKLDTDASSVGLGAVLSQQDKDGRERPIEFISRRLSKAERNYSQIDREALAIIWAIKKFHIYLYGTKFKLVTDHKALVFIFDTNRKLPEMSNNRISRYAVTLMSYDYEIIYRNTKDHANCDFLSRLPAQNQEPDELSEEDTVFAVTLEEAMLNAEVIIQETRRDPVLSRVYQFTLDGWPAKVESANEEMCHFQRRRDELGTESGCVTWGNRVVIPTKLRPTVLEMLHLTHVGMTGMKMLARSYVWWPNLNADIERLVKTCKDCKKYSKSAQKVTEHPWSRTSGPWQRIHMDFAGPFQGYMWLLIQDAYSKWPEIVKMTSTTAPALTRVLRDIFSRTGIPYAAVSDNGPQFISEELAQFMKDNRIKHILTPTYHPKSNGLAERLVGSFKSAMKKMIATNRNVDKNLANFLLTYRNTPHSTTGESPAIRMYNRTLRSKLHQLTPTDRQKKDELQLDQQKKVLEAKKHRIFHEKQPVRVQISDKTWLPAVIISRVGESNVYNILHEGRVIKKHADHILDRQQPLINLNPGIVYRDRVNSDERESSIEVVQPNSVVDRANSDERESSIEVVQPNSVVDREPVSKPVEPVEPVDSVNNETLNDSVNDNVNQDNVVQDNVRPSEGLSGLRRSQRVPKPRKVLDL
ncbi:hypothetical protein ACHWQZ_G015941 [Mnemiopsis leidyi]